MRIFIFHEAECQSWESDLWPWLVNDSPNEVVKMSAAFFSVGNLLLSQPLAYVHPRRESKGRG